MTKQEKINKVIDSVKSVLIEKNKRYGNAALSPINVFYKGDAQTSICIRLDDKLSRIKNSDVLRKNDMFDLLGYCILLQVDYLTRQSYVNAETPFKERLEFVFTIVEDIQKCMDEHNMKSLDYEPNSFKGFSKTEDDNVGIIRNLNGICSDIKNDKYDYVYTMNPYLILFLIQYFVENDITDFSDLID